jgi:hypothetical protein
MVALSLDHAVFGGAAARRSSLPVASISFGESPLSRVTLAAEERDRFRIAVGHVTFNLHDNDKKLIRAAKQKTMDVMWAVEATEVVQQARMQTWSVAR